MFLVNIGAQATCLDLMSNVRLNQCKSLWSRCSVDAQDDDYQPGGAPSDPNWLLGSFCNREAIT